MPLYGLARGPKGNPLPEMQEHLIHACAQCIRDGKSIIMEGLHLDPGLYLYEFGRYGQAHLLEAAAPPRAPLRQAETPCQTADPECTTSAAARAGAVKWRPPEACACAAPAAEGGLAGVGRGGSRGSSRPPAHAGGSSATAGLVAERGDAPRAAPMRAALGSDGMRTAPAEGTGERVEAGVSASAEPIGAEQRSGTGARAPHEASALQCAPVMRAQVFQNLTPDQAKCGAGPDRL